MNDRPRSPHDPFEAERLRAEVHARLFGGGAAPAMIGPWRVLERIGQGAMGTVYRAAGATGEQVAIKIVLGASPHGQARLRREARALRELVHPNIVGIVDVGEFEHGVWVAMDLVVGNSVRALARTARSTAAWIDLLAPIGDALVAVHHAGLVHRDVKPDNILVDDRDVSRLVDFGLAKPEPGGIAAELSHLAEKLTRTGAAVGTVGYASPEQMLGKPVDGRSDQFALAVTLWEVIVGVLPFAGATADAIGLAAIAGRIKPPPPEVPVGVIAVLRRALAPDPANRYGDTAAFVAALRGARP